LLKRKQFWLDRFNRQDQPQFASPYSRL
jgi:hypothetical protein